MLKSDWFKLIGGGIGSFVAVLLLCAICGASAPGYSAPGGVSVSTGLSDSSNLARLNAANAFTNANSITATDAAAQLVVAATEHPSRTLSLYGDASGSNSQYILSSGTLSIQATGNMLLYGNGNNGISYNGVILTRYGSVSTAGWGVPAIYGSGRQEGVSAAAASAIATFTPASDATLLVSGNVLVITTGTIAATMTVTYTDEGNTSRTTTLPFTLVAGTPLTAINFANGAVPYEGLPLKIRVKGGTAATVQTVGTFTGSVYNCEADIIQVR